MGRRLLDGRKLQHVCRWRMKDIGQALGAEEVANMIEHCCSFTVRDGVQAVLAMCVWRREGTGPWLGSLEALGVVCINTWEMLMS